VSAAAAPPGAQSFRLASRDAECPEAAGTASAGVGAGCCPGRRAAEARAACPADRTLASVRASGHRTEVHLALGSVSFSDQWQTKLTLIHSRMLSGRSWWVHHALLGALVRHHGVRRPRTLEPAAWLRWAVDIVHERLGRDRRRKASLGIHVVGAVMTVVHERTRRLLQRHWVTAHGCGRPSRWHEAMAARQLTHAQRMPAAWRHAVLGASVHLDGRDLSV
jgi:hypothetical protein